MFDSPLGMSLVDSSLHVAVAHHDPEVVAGDAEAAAARPVQVWPPPGTPVRGADGRPVDPGPAGADAAAMATGPDLAAQLAAIEVGGLSAAGRLDYLIAQQRLASWVESLSVPVLVDHAGLTDQPTHANDTFPQDRHHSQAADIAGLAATLKWSANAARGRAEQARSLTSHLPATLRALRDGILTGYHARVMVELTSAMDVTTAQAVEDRVVPGCVTRGGAGPVASFRQSIRRAMVAVDPEALQRRHRQAHHDRGTNHWTNSDGSATLAVTASPPDIDTIHRALTALAGPADAADPRTLDNRRVDALVALCLGRLPSADPHPAAIPTPLPGGAADVTAHVVVDLPTLLGLADNPCQLVGYGPIPAGTARDWLTSAPTWRRLVTDPVTGHLLDYGPLVRHPPPKLRQFVNTRDQTCTFPGCHQPARRCDNDHTAPWRADGTGGTTSATNLQPLCRHHHNLKTFNHWHVIATHPDRTIWQSPTGRLHTRYRPAVLHPPLGSPTSGRQGELPRELPVVEHPRSDDHAPTVVLASWPHRRAGRAAGPTGHVARTDRHRGAPSRRAAGSATG
jgi:hypothetical protein